MTAARDVMGAGEGGKEKPAVVSSGLKDYEAVQGGSGMHAGVSMQGIGVEVKQSSVSAALGVGAAEGGRTLEWVDAGMSERFQEAEKDAETAQLRLMEKRKTADELIAQARAEEPDLVKRATKLHALDAFNFPDTRAIQSGGVVRFQASVTDLNLAHAVEVLLGKENLPYIDTFFGRIIDHNKRMIDNDYAVVEWTRALKAAGVSPVEFPRMRKAIIEVAKAQPQRNCLTEAFLKHLPEWDGTSRMETLLLDMYKPKDTPLNRMFGRYFWLSLCARIKHPGCLAPIALSLFGGQNAGKSYLGRRINEEILALVGIDKAKAEPPMLDLGAEKKEFLRQMTGSSVVAAVGEMTGYGRGDLNKIKAFMTSTSDKVDFKFENHRALPRQWIVMMDGNKYEGLQRDDTGNRRFYPMFVGQLADVDGQPAWDTSFTADFSLFDQNFCQVMAEANHWLVENGMRAYEAFVRQVSDAVQAFNASEMAAGRGTVEDPVIEAFLPVALAECEMLTHKRKEEGDTGIYVKQDELLRKLYEKSRDKPNVKRLTSVVAKFGGIKGGWKNNKMGFFFPGYEDAALFKSHVCDVGDGF